MLRQMPTASSMIAASKRVFTFYGDSHSASVIDARTGKDVGSIDLGGAPEFAVTDGQGNVHSNLEDKNEVLTIDSRAMKVRSR